MTALPLYPPTLVGRDRESVLLRERLADTLAGRGSLILIGGEAGIGKTALAEALCHGATERGALVLIGRSYDLTDTPPYGPWVELFGRYERHGAVPPLPEAFAQRGTVGAVTSQADLLQQVQQFFAHLSAQCPVVLVLDDLHWADPASLDLLRALARSVATLPLLAVATYRSDALSRHYPLYTLLPTLVHEAHAARLDLQPLEENDVRELIGARYRLGPADAARLIASLQERAEGNPFFLSELLRTLEEGGTLRPTDDGWTVGDLGEIRVPPLLRQVIDGRLARLGERAQSLLGVAAVIGQEVPLALWSTSAGIDDAALLPVIERTVEAYLLTETPDGEHVRFTHALIRDAVYEGLPLSRRRPLHRRTAELLAARSHPDPDAIAMHFQRAGDRRAVEWLVRAGERAHLAYAWLTAATRYEAALALMDAEGEATPRRAWLLHNLAFVCRTSDPQRSRECIEEMTRIAEQVGEWGLAGVGHFRHGQYRYAVGEVASGLAEMAAAIALLESLSPDEIARMRRSRSRTSSSVGTPYGVLMFHLAGAGHYAETLAMEGKFLARTPVPAPGSERGTSMYGDGHNALARAHAALGNVAAARAAYARARTAYRAAEHHVMLGYLANNELEFVALPYLTERHAEHERIAREGERAWEQTRGAVADLPPRLAHLPLLLLRGAWGEARALGEAALDAMPNAYWRPVLPSLLAQLTRRQGEPAAAWGYVDRVLPDGATTEPGTTDFYYGTAMQALAAHLALDGRDREDARAWIEAHDRWLAWNGAVLGRAEGWLLWARYHRQAGDAAQATEHAERALIDATDPRQPLALLAAHRAIGDLHTDAGRYDEAEAHLHESLALATACESPYERALTLLAVADLRAATGQRARAQTLLDEVRAICAPLGAMPALARADAVAARLAAAAPRRAGPDGLTPREAEVLRLIACGGSNQEIAADLSVSVRTVERHVTNIYGKVRARTRAEATAYAFRHELT